LSQFERIGQGLALEMMPPLEVTDLIAVRLAVDEDFDAAHLPLGREAGDIGDELVFADDFVDDEPAD
jgi:hypothetical protein